MHAVVNTLRLKEPIGDEVWDLAERELAARARRIEGFDSARVVRVDDDLLVLVIVADSAATLDRIATEAGNSFMVEHVVPHLAEPPQRLVGEVVAAF
jgi:hypothetical protein